MRASFPVSHNPQTECAVFAMFAKACELRCFIGPVSSGCTATCRFPGVAYLHVE